MNAHEARLEATKAPKIVVEVSKIIDLIKEQAKKGNLHLKLKESKELEESTVLALKIKGYSIYSDGHNWEISWK